MFSSTSKFILAKYKTYLEGGYHKVQAKIKMNRRVAKIEWCTFFFYVVKVMCGWQAINMVVAIAPLAAYAPLLLCASTITLGDTFFVLQCKQIGKSAF
jgi:hypothetical protein